ncbi:MULTISPECIES: SCO7460 family lipoprotein [unclassified Streptomyces]|uniref:SCO7460 family lipoprotein n=1 Tax=unclassified Streptomyces TaxID=2593676 RepID=UPI0037AEBB60
MAGSRRRQWRVALTGALAGSLVLLMGACGVVDTKDDRRAAEELAEKHFPGQLKAIGARTLFPGSGGSEVTFAVADDRDAVVRLRIDTDRADEGLCDRKDCAVALARAVQHGRQQADDFRTLKSAFDSCGYEVIALDTTGTPPYVVAELTNANVTKVLREIGDCVQRWVTASGADSTLAKAVGSYVNVVSPAVADRRDRGKDSWPTMMRLTRSNLLASLTKHAYHSASYEIEAGRVDTAGSARIVRPFRERQKFGDTVQNAVREQLRATYPRVVMSSYQWIWRLEPGRIDRQTGYVLFCPEPGARGQCVNSDDAALVTTDEHGNPVGKIRLVHDVREGTGALRLPPY